MRKKRGKRKWYGLLLGLLCFIPALSTQAGSMYDSPYVTLSPDGTGWTINAGEIPADGAWWYPEDTIVETGIESSRQALQTGQHYYSQRRNGMIPISQWRVEWENHTCIHNADTDGGWLGYIEGQDYFDSNKCYRPLYSGWYATCADCGREFTALHYMSREAAESIKYMDVGDEISQPTYYYICPYGDSKNLEQSYQPEHDCDAVSWNKYIVQYNGNGAVGGYMAPTWHMYNNETMYEGEEITPDIKLRKNAYVRQGYVFVGWNTRPNGTGITYTDEQSILNLTTADYGQNRVGATITLYAQWQQSTNTLQIDPAGGKYQGNNHIASLTRDYGAVYHANASQITPPNGALVRFNTQGGNAIGDIRGAMSFYDWTFTPGTNSRGTFINDHYTFLGVNGVTDRVTAQYTRNSITLPNATKTNASFAGWYTDAACSDGCYVGKAGDSYTPTADTTLYAKWVTLVLYATDDYAANNQKGAVDLNWLQPDEQDKTYIVKQRKEGGAWVQLTTATEANNSPSVDKTFFYSGEPKTYTVPYTGLYTLTAAGAQGGSYDEGDDGIDIKTGGQGGRTTGNVWLEAGEVLTYTIGGQNGYNGGGEGDTFANGGGCTTITVERDGETVVLLVAGGGGGATSEGNGGEGGSTTSNIDTGYDGEDGGAGGGGGYRGGSAGELIVHHHNETEYNADTNPEGCVHTDYYDYNLITSDYTVQRNVSSTSYTLSPWMMSYQGLDAAQFTDNTHSETKYIYGIKAHARASGSAIEYRVGQIKNPAGGYSFVAPDSGYIPVNGNTTLKLGILLDGWGGFTRLADSFVEVYDQDGNLFWRKTAAELPLIAQEGGAYNNDYSCRARWLGYDDDGGLVTCYENWFREDIPIPEGVTNVYIRAYSVADSGDPWFAISLREISFTGGSNSQYICGMEEGQILSSNPAYGGSNYVNTGVISTYTEESGVRQGNGYVKVNGSSLGYHTANRLDDVAAPDEAAPDVPAINEAFSPIGTDRIQVSWNTPADHGTKYFHQVFSYGMINSAFTGNDLVSNVTVNTLTTGVKGFYYYLSSTSGHTPSTEWNYQPVTQSHLIVTLKNHKQYLHVAAVDVAGNLSGADILEIAPINEVETDWEIVTSPVNIEEGENVYRNPGTDIWYVRADGVTPFELRFLATIHGNATVNYQIDKLGLQIENTQTEQFQVAVPKAPSITNEELVYTSDLSKTISAPEYFADAAFLKVTRSNWVKDAVIQQKFTTTAAYNGQQFLVVPRAAAGENWSQEDADRNNALRVIADAEAPVISGTEILNGLDTIDRENQDIRLMIQATDALSGLRELKVIVRNTDNYCEQTYIADASGRIEIDISEEDYLYTGDFTVVVTAVDRVGNIQEESYETTEFFLKAELKRILEPHTPVFQCGESGILTLQAGGYVDKVTVTFPEEINRPTEYNSESYNRSYEYHPTEYSQEESIQFMIPLYTEEREYTVIVTAYKEGQGLKTKELMFTVNGTVTDDFRTRLR